MSRLNRHSESVIAAAGVLGGACFGVGGTMLVGGAGPAWLGAALLGAGAAASVAVGRARRRRIPALPSAERDAALDAEHRDLRARFDAAMGSFLEQERRFEAQRRHLNREVRNRTSKLIQNQRELARRDRLRDEFVSLLTHELRTPLTSVRSYVELLLAYGGDVEPREREEFLQIIRGQVQRVSRLVEELLDLSRLRLDRMQVVLGPCDLSATIERAIDSIRPIARDAAKDLFVSMSSGLPEPIADPERVEQIVLNLLSNAVKYSGDGRVIRVEAAAADDRVLVKVVDAGPGIEPEERAQVFEPFYRTRSVGQSNIEGTGLGLYLSREIARRMHGDLRYEPDPGGGACFVLDLPTSQESRATDPARRSAPAART